MPDNKKNIRSRRRGVRASRVKLTEALAAAGIKTQAALAERIADLESLDAAPRDVVYRVFRQQPVDLSTLTRVARALEVPVHRLLLSSDDVPIVDDPEEAEKETGAEPEGAPGDGPAPRRAWLIWGGIALAAVAVAAFLWIHIGPPSAGERGAQTEDIPLADLSELRIVVRPFEGDAGGLAEALRGKLEQQARVAPAGISVSGHPGDRASRIAGRLGADVVLDGNVLTIGRHIGLRVFAWSGGAQSVIWTSSATRRTFNGERESMAAAIVLALRQDLAGAALEGAGPAARKAYLRGRYHLDQSRTELNVKRAITRFEAALRDYPDYARAHAGLCLALQQENLISSTPGTLADAEQACARAHELAPDLPVVRHARAGLARRNGRHDEARHILSALLEQNPEDVDALMGMAENELAIYRKSGSEDARAAAIDYAQRATAAEPGFWKAPFTLARIHFFTGDIDAAIVAAEAAVAADANQHSVSNLGTFYFCRGDHDEALEQYLRTREIAPNASPGDSQMCVAYYFAREFDKAVQFCKAAIEVDSAGGSPARHEMWGNLADSYRQAGQPVNAADAYARAAELAERKLLTRGYSPNGRAHLAYYYVVLNKLAAERVPDAIAGKLEGELDDAFKGATDPQAMIRIASAWALLGRMEQARAAYAKGTTDCPGFGASPDLDLIRP